jgi:hypothetical protein
MSLPYLHFIDQSREKIENYTGIWYPDKQARETRPERKRHLQKFRKTRKKMGKNLTEKLVLI